MVHFFKKTRHTQITQMAQIGSIRYYAKGLGQTCCVKRDGIGRGGGGQVVSMLAFYSNDPSSNPADAYSFSVKFVFEKNENKQKEAGVGPFLKKTQWNMMIYFAHVKRI